MSVVIGIVDKHTRKIYLGADSRASSNGMYIDNIIKVFRYSLGVSIGVSGRVRTINILQNIKIPTENIYDLTEKFREMFKSSGHSEIENNYESQPSQFLVAFGNKLYRICEDFAYMEIKEFDAIGSGSDLALGSLHATEYLNKNLIPKEISPRERIRLAIAAAEKFDSSVGGPVTIMEI